MRRRGEEAARGATKVAMRRSMVEPTIEDARRMQMLSAVARSSRPASAPSSAARPKDRRVTGKPLEAGRKKTTGSLQRKSVGVKDRMRREQEEPASALRNPSSQSSFFKSLSCSMPATSPWSLQQKQKLWRRSVPLSEDVTVQEDGHRAYPMPSNDGMSGDEEFLQRGSGSFMQKSFESYFPSMSPPTVVQGTRLNDSHSDLIRQERLIDHDLNDELDKLKKEFDEAAARNRALQESIRVHIAEKEEAVDKFRESQQRLSKEMERIQQQEERSKKHELELQEVTSMLKEEREKVLRLKSTIETLEHDLHQVLKEKDNSIHALEKSLAKEKGENSHLKSDLHETELSLGEERMKMFHFEHKIMEQGQQIEYLKRVRDEQHQNEKQYQARETEWNQKFQNMEAKISEYNGIINQLRETIENHRDQASEKSIQIALLQERVSYADKTIDELRQKLALTETTLREQVQKVEKSSHNEQATMYQIHELQDKLKDALFDVKSNHEAKVVLEEHSQRLQNEVDQLRSVCQSESKKSKELKKDLEDKSKTVEEMKAKLASQDSLIHSLRSDLNDLRSNNGALEDENKSLAHLKLQLEDVQSKHEMTETKYRAQQELLNKQSQVLRALQERASSTELQLSSLKGEYEQSLVECEGLQERSRRMEEEMGQEVRDLKKQLMVHKRRANKGAELNSQLLGLVTKAMDGDVDQIFLEEQLEPLKIQ